MRIQAGTLLICDLTLEEYLRSADTPCLPNWRQIKKQSGSLMHNTTIFEITGYILEGLIFIHGHREVLGMSVRKTTAY